MDSPWNTLSRLPVVVVFLFLFLAPCLGFAATYYASPSGGGATCSQGSPCSLNTVVTKPSCGDTVYLLGGTYNQSIDVPAYNCGSFSNAVTIASAPGETAIIRGPGGDRTLGDGGPNTYIIFDRLVIDGTNSQYTVSFGGSFVRFQDGEIRNASQYWAGPCEQPAGTNWGPNVLVGGGHHVEFLSSRIHHSLCSYAIYLSSAHDVLIDGCELDHNGGYGFQMYTGDYSTSYGHHVIRNNQIHDNGFVRGIGIGILRGGDGVVLYNNVAWNNWGGLEVGGTNMQIYNNTIFGSVNEAGIIINGQNTIVRNNIVFNNAGTITDAGSGTVQLKNLTTDPQFVNAGANNFHLRPGSPAIDQGDDLSTVFSTDIEGHPRPTGSAWDQGAYEVSGPPPPTRLRFTTQPQSTPLNQPLAAVVVQAQDASGNLASSFTQNITVALIANNGVVPFAQTSLDFTDPTEFLGEDGAATNALDGFTTAGSPLWHTQYTPTSTPYPHTLIINLGASYPVNGFRYLPRQDGFSNGTIAQYQLAVSVDGTNWGVPVASGTFASDTTEKIIMFPEKTGQYVWLQALSEIDGNPWASALEVTTLYNAGAGLCPGALAGTTTVPASGGQAAFTTLSVTAPGMCQLAATTAGLTGDTSGTFAITGGATHLAFVAQPATVQIGQTISPVTVQFLDAANNPFPTTQAVDIAIATCPGALLGGTASRAANAAGLATFNDVSVNVGCPNATLVASALGMTSATSAPFAVLTLIPNPFLTGEWTPKRVQRHACHATGGDSNLSSSAPAIHTHTLSCPLPANLLLVKARLHACALITVTTGGTGTRALLSLLLGGTVVARNNPPGVPDGHTTSGWVCFDSVLHADPAPNAPTFSSFSDATPAFHDVSSPGNEIVQPLPLATSSPLSVAFGSQWATAGDGQNSLTLHAMIVGLSQ
jgi:hypothetical protein